MKQAIDLREIFGCLHENQNYVVIKGYQYVTTFEPHYSLPLSIRSYTKDDYRYLELIGEGYKSCHITALLQHFLWERFKMVMVFRGEYAEEDRIVYELFSQEEMEKDLEDR